MEVSRLSRPEVEDRIYQLTTQNLELKKQRHAQDDKMKKLATKILRLKSDMKKLQAGKPTKYTNENELIEDLQMRISKQEQEIATLKQKLLLAKNVTPDKNKQNRSYGFVEPRIDTGLPYKPGGIMTPNKKTPGVRTPGRGPPTPVKGPPFTSTPQQNRPPQFPQYGQSMLNNAKQEIQQLDDIVDQLRYQVQVAEDEKVSLLTKQQDLELEYENKLLSLREQLLEQQKHAIDEDIDVINLQRKLKDFEEQVGDGDVQVHKIRSELSSCKKERDAAEEQVCDLRAQLDRLQAQLRSLRGKADDSMLQSAQAHELSIALDEVERERELLKQENSRLIENVFNIEKEKNYKQNERKLRDRVRQLEHRLERLQNIPQRDTEDHDTVFDKYLAERDRAADLEHAVGKLELTNRDLEIQLERTRDILESEEKTRVREREKELQKEKKEVVPQTTQPTPSTHLTEQLQIPVVPTATTTESEARSQELESEVASLVLELDKINMLLDIQYKLKKEYQDEVCGLTTKHERACREFARREDESSKLLDTRNHKINKLELQLRDIAYGTKQVRIEPAGDIDNNTESSINLERGQNIVEVHLGKLYVTQEAQLDPDDKLFMVLNFYHFESLITKVVSGRQPDFNTTSQYIVSIDDFFLKSLQKESASLFLYSCNGTQFRCVGACQINFKGLLDQTSNNRVHGSLQILGTSGDMSGVVFANIEYYTRIKFPITHSLALFKERVKAGAYIGSNAQASDGGKSNLTQENYNELKITVVSCSGLKSSTPNQPSPYVMYKLYTFEDHATGTVEASNDPQFNDTKVFPLTTDPFLHRYLSQASCRFYLFDDSNQREPILGYIDVPLLPLANGNDVSGMFVVRDSAGKEVGRITVKLDWVVTYLPPPTLPDILTPDVSRGYVNQDIDTEPQKLVVEDSERRRKLSSPREEAHNLYPEKDRAPRVSDEDKKQVTFKMETPANPEVKPAKEEGPRTDFISFRSMDEYEKAVKKQKERVEEEERKKKDQVEENGKREEEARRKKEEEDRSKKEEEVRVKPVISQVKRVISRSFDDSDSDDTPPLEEARAPTPPEEGIEDLDLVHDVESLGSPVEDHVMAALPGLGGTAKQPLESTFFEDVPTDEEDSLEEITERMMSSDDDLVMTGSHNFSQSGLSLSRDLAGMRDVLEETVSDPTPRLPPIVVIIHYITFLEGASFFAEGNVDQVFVEYKLLNVDPADTETPGSVRVTPTSKLFFNFRKTFYLERGSEDLRMMKDILQNKSEREITFTVVSDPGTDDGECINLCRATALLPTTSDVIEQELPLYGDSDMPILGDKPESQGERVGSLCITIETEAAINALRANS